MEHLENRIEREASAKVVFKSQIKKKTGKSLIPGMRCLFEAIKGLMQLANMIGKGWISEALWLCHVDVFLEDAMKKGISDI